MEFTRCFQCMEEITGYPCPHCGYDPEKCPSQSFVLRPGTILRGKYVIGAVLGQGGFGITYIGWDLSIQRKVAIKEYYPSGQVSRSVTNGSAVEWHTSEQARFARDSGMEIFLKEARKMARVADVPQVVNVLEVFRENETAYIIMDYVKGETLKKRLEKTGPLTWDQAKRIFLPVAEAMARVHDEGLIHRDISPDNLMLMPDGSVKILDLGAAKDLSINTGTSSMQVAKGGFSPLEQYAQQGGSGPWTDVYALAATMYFALTGILPPTAVDRVSADKLRWDLPELAALPGNVREAIRKAMVILPDKRTRSMAEFADQLAKTSGGTPPHPAFRKWLIPVLAAAAAVAVLLIFVLAKPSGRPEPPTAPPTSAPTAPPTTASATVPTTAPTTFPTTAPTTAATTEPPVRQSFMMCAVENLDQTEREQWPSQTFWGQKKYKREDVTRVIFYDSKQSVGSSWWDVSQKGDGSVRAWMDGSTLCVAADGLICLNQDSSCLFAGFVNARQISFNDAVDTSRVENMCRMFSACESLTSLDVSFFATSRVLDMSHMFATCETLTTLDLSSFDTSQVEDMESMFYGCKNLTSVNLDSFDTSNVRKMVKMFAYCGKLPTIDVSRFDTRRVTDMSHMFRNCASLQRVDVSGFNTSNVTKINSMFYKCTNLSSVDLRGFDTSRMYGLCHVLEECPLITNIETDGWVIVSNAKYDCFMDNGDTINGIPWKSFFKG